jgi:tetratricopeptide (TPR) repeat protein
MSHTERATVLRRGRGVFFSFALGISLLTAAERRASATETDPPKEANAEQRKAQAKSKYEQGVELYRSERYADAVQFFLEADALSPSAALSFNIARAYEKLADDAATLRWYRNYLRLNPEAPNGAEVRQSIQTLGLSLSKKGIQQLTVLSTPPGATVAIDGLALGVTPLTVELKPGAHHALVTLRGFADAARDFTLSAPAPMDLSIGLEPAPAVAPPFAGAGPTAQGMAAPPKERGRRFGVAPYITLGVGALALGGAAYFEASRRSAQNAARDDNTQLATQADLDAMNSRQTVARVMFGVGGVLVVTGATLLVFNTRLSPESTASMVALPGGASFSFSRSF